MIKDYKQIIVEFQRELKGELDDNSEKIPGQIPGEFHENYRKNSKMIPEKLQENC